MIKTCGHCGKVFVNRKEIKFCSRKCGYSGRVDKTHCKSHTNTYRSWAHMIQRCNNLNYKSYKNYGGRGISISTDWLNFDIFYKDMGDRPEHKSLDRIDNDKGYSKENCKWSTRKEQNGNKRNNVYLNYKGDLKILRDWAVAFNMKYETLRKRIKLGWSIEKALETPVNKIYSSSRSSTT